MHTLVLTLLAASLTPAERVDQFVRAEHGWKSASAAALQPFHDDPQAHLPALLGYLEPTGLSDDESFQRRRYAANAAGLLASECDKDGRQALLSALEDLRALRKDLLTQADKLRAALPRQYTDKDRAPLQALGRRIDRLLSAEGAALYALAAVKDDGAVKLVLSTFEKDFDLQLVSIDYLATVAPKDQAVLTAIASLQKSTQSPMIRARLKKFP